MNVSVNSTSFIPSFLKGSLFTVLLLIIFCGWAFLKGDAYKELYFEDIPAIAFPVIQLSKIEQHSLNEEDHLTETEENHVDESAELKIDLHDESMLEESPYGQLPIISKKDNIRPFDAYKRNFIQPAGQKKLQIIIGPIGLSYAQAKQISEKLPQDISILISPYAKNPDAIMRLYKESGHETWLQLPIESYNAKTVDTGPLSLRTDYSGEKNMTIYKEVMGRTSGYTGLFMMNADNTPLSWSSARLEQLQSDLYQRGIGLAYVAGKEIPSLTSIANAYRGDVRRIPEYYKDDSFDFFQKTIEDHMKVSDHITVLMSPHPNDIDHLAEWIKTLSAQGYVLAPLSANAM